MREERFDPKPHHRVACSNQIAKCNLLYSFGEIGYINIASKKYIKFVMSDATNSVDCAYKLNAKVTNFSFLISCRSKRASNCTTVQIIAVILFPKKMSIYSLRSCFRCQKPNRSNKCFFLQQHCSCDLLSSSASLKNPDSCLKILHFISAKRD